jgi:hypothetical protein
MLQLPPVPPAMGRNHRAEQAWIAAKLATNYLARQGSVRHKTCECPGQIPVFSRDNRRSLVANCH